MNVRTLVIRGSVRTLILLVNLNYEDLLATHISCSSANRSYESKFKVWPEDYTIAWMIVQFNYIPLHHYYYLLQTT
jgi:hypothetical protein